MYVKFKIFSQKNWFPLHGTIGEVVGIKHFPKPENVDIFYTSDQKMTISSTHLIRKWRYLLHIWSEDVDIFYTSNQKMSISATHLIRRCRYLLHIWSENDEIFYTSNQKMTISATHLIRKVVKRRVVNRACLSLNWKPY